MDANVCSQMSTFCFVYQLCMLLTRQVLLRLCDTLTHPSFRSLDPGHTCKYAHTDTCILAPYLFFLFFFLSCRSPNKKPNAPSSGPLFPMCYCTYYTHTHRVQCWAHTKDKNEARTHIHIHTHTERVRKEESRK